jgi:hypothetical protein
VSQIRSIAAQGQACFRAPQDGGVFVAGARDLCKTPLYVADSYRDTVDWSKGIHIALGLLPISGYYPDEPGYTYGDAPDPSQSYLFDPLSTMLHTREARGWLALDRAKAIFGGVFDPDLVGETSAESGYFPHQLPTGDLGLPLGWLLSPQSAQAIEDMSVETDQCLSGDLAPKIVALVDKSDPAPSGDDEGEDAGGNDSDVTSTVDTVRGDNACTMRLLAEWFDPFDKPLAYSLSGY